MSYKWISKSHWDFEKDWIKGKEKEITKDLMDDAVQTLQRMGKISNEEYTKYILDETGEYVPKLIKEDGEE